MNIEPRSFAILVGVTAFAFLVSFIAKKTVGKWMVEQRMTTQRAEDFAFWMVPGLAFGACCIVMIVPSNMMYPAALAFILAVVVPFIVLSQRERKALRSDKAAEEAQMNPEQLAERKAQDERNHRTLKIVSGVVVAIFVARFAFGFVSGLVSVDSSADSPRAAAVKAMDGLKSMDARDVRKLWAMAGVGDDFDGFGKASEIVPAWLEGMEYEVVSVDENGDEATVTMNVKARDCAHTLLAAMDEAEAMALRGEIPLSQDRIDKQTGKLLLWKLRAAPLVERKVEMDVEKNGGKWSCGYGDRFICQLFGYTDDEIATIQNMGAL